MNAGGGAWLAVLCLLLALPPPPAGASELTLAPSPAACLSPPAAERGTPEYPAREWTDGKAGQVVVELIFTGPDLRPEVNILRSEGGPAFVESVQRHVRDLRLPCLESADIPARVRINFDFKPLERRGVVPEAIDADRAEQNRQLACVVNGAGPAPRYPEDARRRVTQGRVLVEMRFVNADGPPEITLVSRPASEVFLLSVKRWAEQFRMPCHAGRPVKTRWTLVYRMEGEEHYGFRQTRLAAFLGSFRGIESQRVKFDFNTMGCPFELRLQYLQPLRRNVVVQINEPDPQRQPFVDWLEAAELKLNDKSLDSVFGDRVVLAVPCGKFDLEPRGK